MTTPESDRPTPADAAAGRSGLFARRRSLKSPSEALQPEAAPPPPPPGKKKREGALSAFSGFLSFLLVLCVAGGFGIVALQKKMREAGPLPADKVVYISPGTEVPDIIASLEKEGVIDSPVLLNAELLIEGARSKLKAGEYMFRQGASLREVLDTLVNGRQILHSVTIPEGLTSMQIVERLRGSDVLVGDIKEIPPEGALLPETYKVARGSSVSDLIRKMQDAEKKLLDQVWARRNPDVPLRSPYEMLTLASIVEKETGKADERPRVAGVFVNRLQKRMRLQSDPTIVYGLVGGRGTLGRGILRSEVDKWTPYNTYAIDGLPPGPIANPGRAALEAVANPSRTQELYFVADGTGGHVFAESLDQHSRNVARWRQLEKDAKDKGVATDVDKAAPAAPAAPTTVPAPRAGQRSDLDPKLSFGSLAALDSESGFRVPSPGLTPADAADAITRVGPIMPSMAYLQTIAAYNLAMAPPAVAETPAAAPAPTRPAKGGAVLNASFSDPGIKVRGVDPDDTLDGPVTDEGSAETFPVSPRTLAEQKAAAAKYGLAPINAAVPETGAAPQPVQSAQMSGEARRPRAFDASEGTALDPLRNKSWDLNSPKTVPKPSMSYR
jgi:UPF0755 protein